MGWGGALGGVGKGLQGYSKILGEKRRADWESQQLQLQNERAIHLEELRGRNKMKAVDKAFENQTKLQDTAYGRQSVGFYDGQEVTREELSALKSAEGYSPDKFKNDKEYELALKRGGRAEDLDFEEDKARRIATVTTDIQQEQRNKQADDFVKQARERGIPEDTIKAEVFAIHNPDTAERWAKLAREGKISAEDVDMIKKASDYHLKMLERFETYKDAKGKDRDADIAKAIAHAEKTGESAANLYATGMTESKFGVYSRAWGEKTPSSGTGDEVFDLKNSVSKAKFAKDVKNGVKEALDKLPYASPSLLEYVERVNGRDTGGGDVRQPQPLDTERVSAVDNAGKRGPEDPKDLAPKRFGTGLTIDNWEFGWIDRLKEDAAANRKLREDRRN